MTKAISFSLLVLLLASSTQYAVEMEIRGLDAALAGEPQLKGPYDKDAPGDDKSRAESARSAAEQGSASAQYNLGLMYRKGRGVRQDDKKAVAWYEKAAAQGHARAQANLGFMYENGFGCRKDGGKAIEMYRKAAAQGVAVAQFNLGVHYSKGDSTPRDDVRAYSWFSLAAENGYGDAKEQLQNVGTRLTSAQKAEARKLARELGGRAKR